jgi:hypothetical protein
MQLLEFEHLTSGFVLHTDSVDQIRELDVGPPPPGGRPLLAGVTSAQDDLIMVLRMPLRVVAAELTPSRRARVALIRHEVRGGIRWGIEVGQARGFVEGEVADERWSSELPTWLRVARVAGARVPFVDVRGILREYAL